MPLSSCIWSFWETLVQVYQCGFAKMAWAWIRFLARNLIESITETFTVYEHLSSEWVEILFL